jgi:hypothetical protein
VVSDSELVKRLNLLRTQPAWVYREAADGRLNVLRPAEIPAGDGFYWLAGVTITAGGSEIASVFIIDTDSGAEQYQVYWYHRGTYYAHDESAELIAQRGVAREAFFPYSWRYAVPVACDIHA